MRNLNLIDPVVSRLIQKEKHRQILTFRLIPSENYVSKAVMEATGSILTNKYSEGYANKRYYEGQQYIDQIETLCIERAKSLFGADHANVQPYSGSPANLAIYFAFCKPGDTIMGLGLPFGGHLTHGWPVSISGKYFNSIPYSLDKTTGRLDMNQIEELAMKHRPKILWCGGSAIPRTIDFAAFSDIAKSSGALLVADIAHIAGLIAGKAHPSPIGHAEVITTTTHKTLRGPRSGMILCEAKHAQIIDRAVFPGLQGGPHNHHTAALAVALHEASQECFKTYAQQIVKNAQVLAQQLLGFGYELISGGTDNHLILIDLTNKGISGKIAAQGLDRAGIETNANSIPFDPRKPYDPSGLRIGTPALTTIGFKEAQMKDVAYYMHQAIKAIQKQDENSIAKIKDTVVEYMHSFITIKRIKSFV